MTQRPAYHRVFWSLLTFLLAAPLGRAHAEARPVTRLTLPNGIRLVVQSEPESPLVAVDAFVGTADAPEDAFRPGLANCVAHTLLSATTNEPEDVLGASVGNLGGDVGVTWDRNFTQLRALALAQQYGDAIYLLSDALKNSVFTDAAVRQSRDGLLQELQSGSDDIYQQTYNQLRAGLYARTPIDPDSIGDADAIKGIKTADVKAFYDKYYTADNIVVSVVVGGNIDPQQVIATLTGDLSDFPRATARRGGTAPPAAVPLAAPKTVKSYRGDLTAGYVMIGYLAPGAGEPDYPAMLLINALLGGMKTSLLFTNLREKQGLGYQTSSSYGEDVGVTDLTGYILSSSVKSSAISHTAQADTTALVSQVKLLCAAPPSAQMLARAKRFVIGSYLTRHERLMDRAYWLGFSEVALRETGGSGFDTDFEASVNAVTTADIQRVAQRYLSDGYVVSMVLPGSATAGEVSR